MKFEKPIKLIIHENGRATLYFGNDILQEVDECSGLDSACEIFNKMMKEKHLNYRLKSAAEEVLKGCLRCDNEI